MKIDTGRRIKFSQIPDWGAISGGKPDEVGVDKSGKTVTFRATHPQSMKKPKTLPSRPSTLVRIAREDLQAVHRDKKNYTVNMYVWHEGQGSVTPTGRCEVCQAGAIMAKTLKGGLRETFHHHSFGAENARRFIALNRLRRGRVIGFLIDLRTDSGAVRKWLAKTTYTSPLSIEGHFTPFSVSPRCYFNWLKKVEAWLISEGL